MLKEIAKLFKSDDLLPTGAIFPSIDEDKIIREMKLTEEGRRRGEKNLPESEAGSLDSVETKILSRVEEIRRRGLENYQNNKEIYSKRVANAQSAHLAVKTIAYKAEGDFRGDIKDWRNRLTGLVDRLRGWDKARTAFRVKHGLDRPAFASPNTALTVFLVISAVVVESALNGYLFASKNEFGLVGGVMLAVLVSVANVSLSGLAGQFSRLARHRGFLKRLAGWMIILAWIGLAFGFNLAVAHFRDAVETLDSWEVALQRSVENLVNAPLGLASMESWLLLVLGCTISIGTFLKFALSGEPYIGYAKTSAQWDRALRTFDDAVHEALAQLSEKRDEAVEELQDAERDVRESIGDAVDALYGQTMIKSHLATFLEQCDLKTNVLLQTYRDANRSARSESAPPHFDQSYAFQPFVDQTVDEGRRHDADEKVREIGQIVNDAIEGIHNAFRELMDEYPDADTILKVDMEDRASRRQASRQPTEPDEPLRLVESS